METFILMAGALLGLWLIVAFFSQWQRDRREGRLDERLSQLARLRAELADREIELAHYRRLRDEIGVGALGFPA